GGAAAAMRCPGSALRRPRPGAPAAPRTGAGARRRAVAATAGQPLAHRRPGRPAACRTGRADRRLAMAELVTVDLLAGGEALAVDRALAVEGHVVGLLAAVMVEHVVVAAARLGLAIHFAGGRAADGQHPLLAHARFDVPDQGFIAIDDAVHGIVAGASAQG